MRGQAPEVERTPCAVLVRGGSSLGSSHLREASEASVPWAARRQSSQQSIGRGDRTMPSSERRLRIPIPIPMHLNGWRPKPCAQLRRTNVPAGSTGRSRLHLRPAALDPSPVELVRNCGSTRRRVTLRGANVLEILRGALGRLRVGTSAGADVDSDSLAVMDLGGSGRPARPSAAPTPRLLRFQAGRRRFLRRTHRTRFPRRFLRTDAEAAPG